jgi:hypothetical protein
MALIGHTATMASRLSMVIQGYSFRCSVNSAITPRRVVVVALVVQDPAAGEALQRVGVGLGETCTPAAQEFSGVAGYRDQRHAVVGDDHGGTVGGAGATVAVGNRVIDGGLLIRRVPDHFVFARGGAVSDGGIVGDRRRGTDQAADGGRRSECCEQASCAIDG